MFTILAFILGGVAGYVVGKYLVQHPKVAAVVVADAAKVKAAI